ncbi:chemotaxis protein CheW [Dongia sp.]|uniref:chemotaxis protein CheW n=1 Tax=Dongia sp. TaxID=1977262 RepID=UPI0037533360
MAQSPTAASHSHDAQFVTLGIDREVFAVPVDAVLEILDMRPMFRIPEAPGYLAGLIDVRGRGVPVIDLRLKLGLPAQAANEMTRILVLEFTVGEQNLVLGLIADRVIEVITLDRREIQPAPAIGLQWRSDYIAGVGRRNDNFVIIFELARLFSSSDVALISATAKTKTAA